MQGVGKMSGIRWIALAVCLAPLLCAGQAAEPGVAASPAVIVNSGSTNIAGFRIRVEKSGNAEYVVITRRNLEPAEPWHRKIPEALVTRLYSGLETARPLAGR